METRDNKGTFECQLCWVLEATYQVSTSSFIPRHVSFWKSSGTRLILFSFSFHVETCVNMS